MECEDVIWMGTRRVKISKNETTQNVSLLFLPVRQDLSFFPRLSSTSVPQVIKEIHIQRSSYLKFYSCESDHCYRHKKRLLLHATSTVHIYNRFHHNTMTAHKSIFKKCLHINAKCL